MRFARTIIASLLAGSLAALSAAAQELRPDNLQSLKELLEQLRVNPYPPPRERAAQIIVALVRRMDVSMIDMETIDEIADLLEDKSDSVRGRMAIALGNIGPAAKHTVPALEKAFERAKEYMAESQGDQQPSIGYRAYGLGTSADSICFALAKLEATIPEGCMDGRYDPRGPADGTVN